MGNPYGGRLFDHHAALLSDSAISVEVARARGYVTADQKTRLAETGIAKVARSVPGLLIPIWDVHGEVKRYQYRPDSPRLNEAGRPIKYETTAGRGLVVDVPPPVRDRLTDPAVPLWITEGSRKADAAASAGLTCVALLGVYGWRGSNGQGGKAALACWESIALNDRAVFVCFDSDIMTKQDVRTACDRLARFLAGRGADVHLVYLPDGEAGAKVGLDDYLAAGHSVVDLVQLAKPWNEKPTAQPPLEAPPAAPPAAAPRDLDHAHQVYRRWLGEGYDLQVLDTVLAVAAAEKLGGDPPWLLVVGGSGAAKTETVAPLAGAGAHVESTITSDAALLSGTPENERAKDATGGLLAKIGPRGLLVLKDFTSIISMNRDARANLLAALREIHDGRWTRNVGAEGGRTLTWSGRLVLIGATTTAYDKAHAVIASMGDRFALVRQDSSLGTSRTAAGRQSLANVGNEPQMRRELATAAAAVLAGVRPELATLTEADHETLLALADVVTLARTGVEHDYRGDVIDAHAPEMPTRFAKMLAQVARGGLALGMDHAAAVAAAVRVAGDSMPPLRLAALADVATWPDTPLGDVRRRLQKPRATVDRTLQALHILGLLTQGEDRHGNWTYRLAANIDPATVLILVTRNVSRHPLPLRKEGHADTAPRPCSDKTGNQDQLGQPGWAGESGNSRPAEPPAPATPTTSPIFDRIKREGAVPRLLTSCSARTHPGGGLRGR